MIANAIYSKTAKGSEEIASRTYRLPARLRTLLILVDGRLTGEDLVLRAAQLGHGPDAFEQLEREAFIAATNEAGIAPAPLKSVEPSPAASALSVAPGPDSILSLTASAVPQAPSNRPGARRSLALARLYLVEFMGRALGKESDAVKDSLRNATDRASLLAQLDLCVEIINETSGPERAEDLRRKVTELLPD